MSDTDKNEPKELVDITDPITLEELLEKTFGGGFPVIRLYDVRAIIDTEIEHWESLADKYNSDTLRLRAMALREEIDTLPFRVMWEREEIAPCDLRDSWNPGEAREIALRLHGFLCDFKSNDFDATKESARSHVRNLIKQLAAYI